MKIIDSARGVSPLKIWGVLLALEQGERDPGADIAGVSPVLSVKERRRLHTHIKACHVWAVTSSQRCSTKRKKTSDPNS